MQVKEKKRKKKADKGAERYVRDTGTWTGQVGFVVDLPYLLSLPCLPTFPTKHGNRGNRLAC